MSGFNQFLWGTYLVAALGLILMLWYSLRGVRLAVVQDVPVVVAMAVLLTPCSALPGSAALAPALVVTILEGLLDDELTGWRGGVPILLALVTLMILLFTRYWVTARFFSPANASVDSPGNNPGNRPANSPGDSTLPDPDTASSKPAAPQSTAGFSSNPVTDSEQVSDPGSSVAAPGADGGTDTTRSG